MMGVVRRLPGWDNGHGLGGWLLMSLVLIVCVALLGAVIYMLVRAAGSDTGTHPVGPGGTRPRAESALDERFARGEIDEDEYLRGEAEA